MMQGLYLYEDEGQLEGSGAFLSFLVPGSKYLYRDFSIALYQVLQGCLCLQKLLHSIRTPSEPCALTIWQ